MKSNDLIITDNKATE